MNAVNKEGVFLLGPSQGGFLPWEPEMLLAGSVVGVMEIEIVVVVGRQEDRHRDPCWQNYQTGSAPRARITSDAEASSPSPSPPPKKWCRPPLPW